MILITLNVGVCPTFDTNAVRLMPSRPQRFRPRGAPSTQAAAAKAADLARGSARARGYDTSWDKASKAHQRDNPLCRYCEAGAFGPARVTATALTDHLYPHRGDRDLFWARQWWVASCVACHSGPKQALEARGPADLDQLARLIGLEPRG